MLEKVNVLNSFSGSCWTSHAMSLKFAKYTLLTSIRPILMLKRSVDTINYNNVQKTQKYN
uniref:Uncharacterized protein n=1 Tax=Onchocerca volvulus TaxID=6282 RepID=A0A8R1XQV7_ONCVO